MSNMSDHDIDNLFRKAAERYNTTFDESAWASMNDRLDGISGKLTMAYYKAIGVVVSLFMITALLIWWKSPVTADIANSQTSSVAMEKSVALEKTDPAPVVLQNSATASLLSETKGLGKNTLPVAGNLSAREQNRKDVTQNERIVTSSSAESKVADASEASGSVLEDPQEKAGDDDTTDRNTIASVDEIPTSSQHSLSHLVSETTPEAKGTPQLVSETQSDTQEASGGRTDNLSEQVQEPLHDNNSNQIALLATIRRDFVHPVALSEAELKTVQTASAGATLGKEKEEEEGAREEIIPEKLFSLKLAVAPDLSSVGYFEPDRPGSNIGFVGEYYLGKRWSISSGVIWSHKIYFSDERESYGTYGGSSDWRLDAECTVLDVPVNLSYYVKQSTHHNMSCSFGLSSYFMLTEDYNYFEDSGGNPRRWSERIEGENNHYFSMLNLSFAYERRLYRNFFFQLEPFLKAPLSGVGEGKVDLVSSGLFLSLKYNFLKPL